MLPQLLMGVVVITIDGGIFQRAVHPLDLAIGLRVVRLGQPVFDAVLLADAVKSMKEGICAAPDS